MTSPILDLTARYKVAFDAWAKTSSADHQLFSNNHYEKLWASAFLTLGGLEPDNVRVRASVRHSKHFEAFRPPFLFPQLAEYSVEFVIHVFADKTRIARHPRLVVSPKRVQLLGVNGASAYTNYEVPRSLYDVDPGLWDSIHERAETIWNQALSVYDWERATRKAMAHFKKRKVLATGGDTPLRRAKTKIAHESLLAHMLKKSPGGQSLSADEFVQAYRLIQSSGNILHYISSWISTNSVSSQFLSDQELRDVHAGVLVHQVHQQ